jgi:hypothetical protein
MAGLESAPRPPVRAAERIRPRFPFFHRNRVVLSIQNHHLWLEIAFFSRIDRPNHLQRPNVRQTVAATVHEVYWYPLNVSVRSKPQVCLASKPSRHQRSDGDCALRLATSVASKEGQVGARQSASRTVATTDVSVPLNLTILTSLGFMAPPDLPSIILLVRIQERRGIGVRG